MKIPTYLTKFLLSTCLAAALALATTNAIAEDDATKVKTYNDPVSGQLKVAPKLLSEMSAEERAALSAEEVKYLEKIESLVEERESQSQ